MDGILTCTTVLFTSALITTLKMSFPLVLAVMFGNATTNRFVGYRVTVNKKFTKTLIQITAPPHNKRCVEIQKC